MEDELAQDFARVVAVLQYPESAYKYDTLQDLLGGMVHAAAELSHWYRCLEDEEERRNRG